MKVLFPQNSAHMTITISIQLLIFRSSTTSRHQRILFGENCSVGFNAERKFSGIDIIIFSKREQKDDDGHMNVQNLFQSVLSRYQLSLQR